MFDSRLSLVEWQGESFSNKILQLLRAFAATSDGKFIQIRLLVWRAERDNLKRIVCNYGDLVVARG